jgi:hypothetical protein
MIVQEGEIVAPWGDIAHKVNVRSIRKSLLSALYGIGVAEGQITLDRTLINARSSPSSGRRARRAGTRSRRSLR